MKAICTFPACPTFVYSPWPRVLRSSEFTMAKRLERALQERHRRIAAASQSPAAPATGDGRIGIGFSGIGGATGNKSRFHYGSRLPGMTIAQRLRLRRRYCVEGLGIIKSPVQVAAQVVARRHQQAKPKLRQGKWNSIQYSEPTKDPKVAFERLPLPDEPCDFQIPSSVRKFSDKVTQKAPAYVHIKRNVYLIKKPRKKSEDEGMQCSCKGSKVCAWDCICRMLYTSCSASCSCKDGCVNQPFQKRTGRMLKVVKTEACGWGLIAAENIKAGDFLIEYVGEVIDDKTCEERLWAMKARGETNFYLCEISRDMVIDATFKGNLSRFINHSCQPNSQLRKWQCDGELRIGVFATTNIPEGRQITYDYQFIQFGTDQECHCGSAKCRRKLGSKPTKQLKQKLCPDKTSGILPLSNPMQPVEPRRFSLYDGMIPLNRFFVQRKRTVSSTPEPSRDAARDKTTPNCVGHRVRVWWPLDQKYYSGRIVHYDPVLGKHQILYDDGEKEELLLCKERWTWDKSSSGHERAGRALTETDSRAAILVD